MDHGEYVSCLYRLYCLKAAGVVLTFLVVVCWLKWVGTFSKTLSQLTFVILIITHTVYS